jgi:predicted ATP-dependent endonuclease of OLD family
MINQLKIEDFRCFKDFRIDELARVNLIVGGNDSGKTSFLEAIRQTSDLPCGVVSYSTTIDAISHSWEGITLTPKEGILIEALRLINPDIERVSFTFNNGMVLKISDQGKPTPLTVMSRGIQRLFILVVAALSSENGILLVDEIDTSLSPGVQVDLWALLFKISEQFNIQIFATTHSWDCLCAFRRGFPRYGGDEGKMFRLSRKDGITCATAFTHKELMIAVREEVEEGWH